MPVRLPLISPNEKPQMRVTIMRRTMEYLLKVGWKQDDTTPRRAVKI
jgi:hypothetical protein